MHLSLAEFDMAFKALSSYLELVKKSKARERSLGSRELGLDNDAYVIETAHDGAKSLCLYGGDKELSRSTEVAQLIKSWIQVVEAGENSRNDQPGQELTDVGNGKLDTRVTLNSFSKCHQVIGICQAFAARSLTSANARRPERTQAISTLRISLTEEFGDHGNLESLFALGTLLAESYEIDQAIEIVRTALAPHAYGQLLKTLAPSSSNLLPKSDDGSFPISSKRRLLPLWHLLILLLSARQEYGHALEVCEQVLSYFAVHLEPEPSKGSLRSHDAGHNGSSTSQLPAGSCNRQGYSTLVDDVEAREIEALLEIKMTQLALLEVVEDAKSTLQAATELLSLYHQLLGDPSDLCDGPRYPLQTRHKPPKSATATVRSIRASLLGRPKSTRSLLRKGRARESSSDKTASVVLSRPQTQGHETSSTPIIQVTQAPKAGMEKEVEFDINEYSASQTGAHQTGRLHKQGESLNQTGIARNYSRKLAPESPGDTATAATVSPNNHSFKHELPLASVPAFNCIRSYPVEVNGVNDQDPGNSAFSADAIKIPQSEHGTHSQVFVPLQPAHSQQPSKVIAEKDFANVLETDKFDSQLRSPQDLPSGAALMMDHKHDQLSNWPRVWLSGSHLRHMRVTLLVRCWLLIAGLYRRAELYDEAMEAIEEAHKLAQSQEMRLIDGSNNPNHEDSICSWLPVSGTNQLFSDVLSEVLILSVLDP